MPGKQTGKDEKIIIIDSPDFHVGPLQ